MHIFKIFQFKHTLGWDDTTALNGLPVHSEKQMLSQVNLQVTDQINTDYDIIFGPSQISHANF